MSSFEECIPDNMLLTVELSAKRISLVSLYIDDFVDRIFMKITCSLAWTIWSH